MADINTFTVTCNTSGSISASTSNSSVATVSVSGKTVTVTPKASGTCNITISAGSDSNYITPTSKTVSVKVKNKSEYNGLDIRDIVRANKASSVFAIGDRWPIKAQGPVGSRTFNETFYAALMGISHNASVETFGLPAVHLKFPYDSTGKQFAVGNFVFNTTNDAYCNWAVCTLRLNQMPQFKSVLEDNWRNAVRPCTKYSDVGKIDAIVASKMQATYDEMFLLSDVEITGNAWWASGEQDYCKRYQYYENGNAMTHYNYDNRGNGGWTYTRTTTGAGGIVIIMGETHGAVAFNRGTEVAVGFTIY